MDGASVPSSHASSVHLVVFDWLTSEAPGIDLPETAAVVLVEPRPLGWIRSTTQTPTSSNSSDRTQRIERCPEGTHLRPLVHESERGMPAEPSPRNQGHTGCTGFPRPRNLSRQNTVSRSRLFASWNGFNAQELAGNGRAQTPYSNSGIPSPVGHELSNRRFGNSQFPLTPSGVSGSSLRNP